MKLNEAENTEKNHVEVSNRFPALEELDTLVDINSPWKTVGENIKIPVKMNLGYHELKKHKSLLINQRKQAKLQWL
jgi:hypothetical protein